VIALSFRRKPESGIKKYQRTRRFWIPAFAGMTVIFLLDARKQVSFRRTTISLNQSPFGYPFKTSKPRGIAVYGDER
jgi:hypothetical protein